MDDLEEYEIKDSAELGGEQRDESDSNDDVVHSGKGKERLDNSGSSGETSSVGGEIKGKKSRLDESELDEWPITSSFEAALGNMVDGPTGYSDLPSTTTDLFVPSLIPEERELQLPPQSMRATHTVNGEGHGMGAEDLMGGVEASQPTDVRVHTEAVEGSSGEACGIDDVGDVDMQDEEYTGDSE